MTPRRSAVLLLAHGSPDPPDDIPEFMKYITGGRPVTSTVIEEVRHRYALVGKSPLTEIAQAQAEGLRRHLTTPVYLGMRNWRPFIAEAVGKMMDEGINHIVAICLAPQSSLTSTALYRRALAAAIRPGVAVQFVESWHDQPLLIQAFAEKLTTPWRQACKDLGALVPVIFTAHSVPTHNIHAGDPHEGQAKETARLVGAKLPGLAPELQRLAFQSQGMAGGPWLGPTVESAILALKEEGHKGVVIAPIGFVCDHVEILYDIDISFRQFAAEQRLKMWRTDSLNASLTFVSALAHLAKKELSMHSTQAVP